MSSDVRPVAWVGAERQERIRGRLLEALDLWSKDWAMDASDSMTVEAVDALDPASAAHRVQTPSGQCLVQIASTGFAELGRRLCGIGGAGGDDIAVGIGTRALRDLLQRLGLEQGNLCLDHEEHQWGPRNGCAFYRIASRLGTWTIAFDKSACGQIAPSTSQLTQSLNDRRSLLESLLAQAEIRLELGEVSVAEGLGLRPGQILETKVPLGALITMQAQGGELLARGELSASETNKAFRCV